MVDIEKILRKRKLTTKDSLMILMVDFIKSKEKLFNLPEHYQNVTTEQLDKKYIDYFTTYYPNSDEANARRYEYNEATKYYNLYHFTNDLLSQAVETTKDLQTSILYLNSIIITLSILEAQRVSGVLDQENATHTINKVIEIHKETVPYIINEIISKYRFLIGYNSFIKALSDYTSVNELERLIYSFDNIEATTCDDINKYFSAPNISLLTVNARLLYDNKPTDNTRELLKTMEIDINEFMHGDINQNKYNYVYNELSQENADFLDEWRTCKKLLTELKK